MIEIIILGFLAGFIFEFIDSFLGGGYGTTLTPLFLAIGYSLPQIVPMILLSEVLTGLIGGGIFHMKFGNVDKTAITWVTPFAIIGTVSALIVSIKIGSFFVNLYIGLLVLVLGLAMFLKYIKDKNNNGKISEKTDNKRLPIIGTFIGFNKAISGGGFGPVLVGGLSWSGYDPKKSVGSTTLTEGLVCVVAFLGYWYLNGLSAINWDLAIPLIIGAVLATPFAAYATHKVPKKILGVMVSLTIIVLGAWILVKLLL
jgi:uncharacterized membrane protein YfcA